MYHHMFGSIINSKNNTNMVNLQPKIQTSPSIVPVIQNGNSNSNMNMNINNHANNYRSNNNNTTHNIINNTNIIDSYSVSDSNSIMKSNQIISENRNQNENANVENYRPTYGAYITSILPRGPYLQYKFNDQHQLQQQQQQQKQYQQQHNHHQQPQQQQLQNHLQETIVKSKLNENDNNEHLNHNQHATNHYTHHTHQRIQSNPVNSHQGHQLDTASASKDSRSLPYIVHANPVVDNNPLSNYQPAYQSQHTAAIAGAGRNATRTPPTFIGNSVASSSSLQNGHQVASTKNMYASHQYMTNTTGSRADLTSQWNSIYHPPPPSRTMRSSSNPSLLSVAPTMEPGPIQTNELNSNWHQINANSNGNQTSSICDKLLPPKGYQTLPHKLKCNYAGGGREAAGQHRQLHLQEDSKSNRTHIKSRSAAPTAMSGTSDFLQHIKQQNSDMLARMSTALAKNYGRTLSQQEIRYPLSARVANGEAGGGISSKLSRSTNTLINQPNCITLDEVVRLKPCGLSENEGWALLCQAVQALQDLFLTDTPSTLRILPLVRPSTIQITSRGRVVFVVTATVATTLGQLNKFNEMDNPHYQDVTAHLAPEFLSSLDKKVTFAESDIEKMWIYSLGQTLGKTIRGQQKPGNNDPALLYDNRPDTAINSDIMSIAKCTNYQKQMQSNQYRTNRNGSGTPNSPNSSSSNSNSNNIEGNGNGPINMNTFPSHGNYQDVLDIGLDQVLGSMCERNLHHRASLMYLLDLNVERGTQRRPPITIDGLRPQFDENLFNFTKISDVERLVDVRFLDFIVTIIVNQSPICKFHSLIVPSLDACLPQILTRDALQFAIRLLRLMNSYEFKIGYNSPGACASVNHLHLHLIHSTADLYAQRAVISTFCRNQQQVKPFSHIMMELFSEITGVPEREFDEPSKGLLKPTILQTDGSRSETDSGRSSAHGDKDTDSNGHYDCQNQVLPISDYNYDQINQQNLRVTRNRPPDNVEYHKYSTIGHAGVKALLMQKKEGGRAPALQVVRRSRDGILKRKNSFRRNTIDINLFDLEKARQENFQEDEKNDLSKSKSTNFIDKIEGEVVEDGLKNSKKDAGKRMEGVSMPDLNIHKMSTLPSTRPKSYRLKSFEALTKAYSEDSFWIKPNGPEFIIKSSLPSREIKLADEKCQNRKVVSVLLLNGQSLHITCNALTTNARQVFEAVIRSENYVENFFIGLCALIGGDFVFLPHDLKIYKVAPQIWVNVSKKTNNIDNVFFTLFLRIKFFLPTLRGISSLESRHMLYLQLRKSILEKHILCTDDDLIILGGLALQAEVGDFKESMKYSDYFTISHYLPEGVYQRNKEMAKYLRNSHYCRQGLHPKEAEQNFIKYIQDMKEYGFHLYSAVWTTDDTNAIDVYVGISLAGIALFERNRQPQANPLTNSKTSYQRKLYMSFEWLEIENLCFSKHILCIAVRKTESLKAKDNNRIKYKLKMDGRKSYFAFSLASEHHQFYMKLRNSFISLKSLSDKLNIPIASPNTTPSTHTIANGVAEQFDGIEFEGMKEHRENHNNVAIKRTQELGTDADKENRETDANRATMANGKTNGGGGSGGIGSGFQENIKKIDKQLKASGLRVRNLKKSMLNDNRLLKLKQRFLRRSKSTVGSCSSTEKSQESDDNRKISNAIERTNNFPVMDDNEKNNNCGRSKEENQNKENECPKVQQLNDLEPKIYSPNRNRVKMGTRVFSTQFLNKSYDNLYDRTLNLYRFESANSISNDNVYDNNFEVFQYNALQKADDELSVRSASLNSLYSSEKMLNRRSESPPANQAYVIHSSIKSEKDTNHHYNNFTLPNETISESLMEKFNNISANNTVTDRIITKVTVVKERLYKGHIPNQQYANHTSHLNNKNDLIYYGTETGRSDIDVGIPTIPQSPGKKNSARIESIKYATLNQKMAKEYSDCVNSRNVDGYRVKGDAEYSKALWHLSRSQESIFINNKFPVRNGCVAVNHNMNNTNNAKRNRELSNVNYSTETLGWTAHGSGGEMHEYTLGISIVQGADNNVYVKDLVKNGPAEKSGIRIGDQIIAVNGVSLLNLSYTESLRLLQNTDLIVELQVSQIFNKNVNSLQSPPGVLTTKSRKDNKNLAVTRGSAASSSTSSSVSSSSNSTSTCPSSTKLNYANKEKRNLNSILTNHCDEYLKRLRRKQEEMEKRNKQEMDNFLFHSDSTNKMKVTRRIGGLDGEGVEKESMKRLGSFEITENNIRATRDKFKSLRNVDGNFYGLSPAKSMPDLPKVVAIIPKPDHPIEDDEPLKKPRIVRSASQSRKYLGPIRYPVTPIKTVLSPIRHQLSLLADSDDEQVFI